VTFLPLDLTNPDSIENVLSHIDYTMQYGEDEEPKEVGATRAAPLFPRLWYPAPTERQAWIVSLSFIERDVRLTMPLSSFAFL